MPAGFELQWSATETFVNVDATLDGGSVGGGFHLPARNYSDDCVVALAGGARWTARPPGPA